MFSQISNSSLLNHAKRLAMAVVFLSFAAIVKAGGGGSEASQEARFYIYTVQLKESTGSGKVYISNQAEGLSIYEEEGSKREFRLSYPDTTSISKYNTSGNWWGGGATTANFHVHNTTLSENVTQTMAASLIAAPDPGTKFEGWTYEAVVLTGNNKYHENYGEYDVPTTYTPTINGNEYKFSFDLGPFTSDMKVSLSQNTAIYAKFTARTYYAEKLPKVEVITINQDGEELVEVGGSTPTFQLSDAPVSGIKMGERNTSFSDYFSQTADNNGQNAEATFMWTFATTPTPNSTYDYLGWKMTEGDYLNNLQTGESVIAEVISEDANKPTEHTIYVIYQLEKFNLFHYDALNDAFNVMGATSTVDGVANYTYSNNEVGEQLFRILSGQSGALTISETTLFTTTLEEINNMNVLRVVPNNPTGGKETITISVAGSPVATLKIDMLNEVKSVTLNPAENLEGTYTYKQNTTGDQAFTVNNAPVTKVLVNPSDFTFTFNPNPISGYAFKRWRVEKTGEQPIYHTTPNLQITFDGGESITPEFEAIKDKAAFIVNGYPDVLYYDLQAAIDAAAKAANSTKVVAVHTNGVLAQGDYTIHSGVTLLVPGKDLANGKYDVLTSALNSDNFSKGAGSWSQYRTLVVEDNTTINVTDGNISLYAELSAGTTSAVAGRPNYFGVMVLGKDCKITVSKGKLYAYGYIIGDNSSEIVMKSGTEVYEAFQFTDFRGGSATQSWFDGLFGIGAGNLKDSEVFPIGQYYIQNIEVPLTLEYGALEYLSTAVYMSNSIQNANMLFLGQSGKNSNQGLLCLGQNGTSVTKMYDPTTDRLSLSVKGPKATLSYMSLSLSVVTLNSNDYIMPIMNNIDIFVEGTQLDMYNNSALAFMPGSTLTLSAGSSITVGSSNRLYFYDHDERMFTDDTGYWGSGNAKMKPITQRPANTWNFSKTVGQKADGANMLYTRAEKDLVDAKMLINGSMTIDGELYTTAGGANITSDGGGTIVVNKRGTATVTQQVSQANTSVSEKSISLSSYAKLHNRETTSINTTNFNAVDYYKFQNYTDVASTGTYIYYQTEGVWKQPEAKISGYKIYNTNNEEIESFNITLPTATAEGYVLCQLVPVNEVVYDEYDFTISLTGESFTQQGKVTVVGNQIKIPITYTAQNKHNITPGVSATLTISKSGTAESVINVNETIPLIAYEDYQPAFTVPSSVLVRSSLKEADGEWHPYALDIQIPEDNVAALAEGANATATAVGNTITLTGHNTSVVWTAAISGTNADQFSFQFGETNNALKDAAVLFRPTTAGTKSATLTLTAKYTDANDPAQELKQEHVITLSGEGAISDNTMDFASVGAIKKNRTFDLLTLVNSSAALSYTINPADQNIIEITPKTDANGKPNYDVKASNIGSVTITVTQEPSTVVKGKTITRTIVVQSNADKLETDGSCIDTVASFNKLTADYENVNYAFVGETPTVSFNTTQEKQSATWSLQFTDMPGYIQFTPSGDGQWSLQESTSGMPGSWTELLAWTEFESGKPVFLPLSPETRAISISYYGITAGKLTDICVYPLTLVPEDNVIYMPIRDGRINETVLFTHNTNSGTIEIKDATNLWGSAVASPENLGGLLQVYYRTPVTINKLDVTPGRYELTATLGSLSADLTIIAYKIPYFLPINSSEWGEADFYHYMNEASHQLDDHYVKWNAEQKKVVFTTPVGEITNPERYVVFGFNGYPTDMSFTSTSRDWTIYSSANAQDWAEVTADIVPIADANGIFTIQRELHHSAKYIKITSAADDLAEVAIDTVKVVGGEVVEITDPTPADPVDLTYAELEISREGDGEAVNTFTLFVANMEQLKVELNSDEFELKRKHVTDETWLDMPNNHTLTNTEYAILAPNKAGEITFQVKWKGTNIVNEGVVSIKNGNDELLATVRLVGKKSTITADDANTGINTGVPNGYTLNGESFEPYTYHEVNVQNAFSMDKEPIFDYLFIYGETTTMDGSTTITTPRIANNDTLGSNAKTPYYIYKKNDTKKGYDFVQLIENANAALKISLDKIDHEEEIRGDENRVTYAIKPQGNTPLNVYITGFCPYATTGSTKDEEGVWYFRGDPGQILNVYLEDCHIYSRNKSENGGPTAKNASPSFTNADVVHGSGAVLVFENSSSYSGSAPFNVTIHTRGHNLLKSNFGCYYTMILNAQVTQVSSPIQIRLGKGIDYNTASTTLNFDDLWPIGETSGNVVTRRTNGFLSLQKLVNNAPSIDMGNSNTIVNFNGGQIQLQNSQIVSPNYKTTLAISYRSGLFGNLPNLKFAYGVGTDAVGGTVKFNDGTTTVLPMKVDEQYRSFYLMDKDAEGKDLATTSCLRCPTNTYVYGGSHCMIRACGNVTSKGGAPKDGPDGKLLGRYIYKNDTTTTPKQGYTYHERVMTELPTDLTGYAEGATVIVIANENMIKYHLVISENGDKQWQPLGNATFFDPYFIVTPTNFPGDLQYNGNPLATYYKSYPTGEYGLQSVTPDDKGNLYFWIPEGVVPDVTPEQDKLITVWKACMTEIEAGAEGITGSIGGSVTVESSEEVRNLLYCQLDEDIYKVISDSIENGVDSEGETIYKYSYAAPVVDPTNQLGPEERYQMISPTHVGANPQEEITSTADYEVTDKIYYITTAMADTWMNFAMPFNVEKIWVVESFPEKLLEEYCKNIMPNSGETRLQATKRYQAKHNADFAAFFGVAMALGADHLDFQGIYERYLEWAMNIADKRGVEGSTGLYESGEYTLRGKYPLTHYNGSNFTTSNFYLYKNTGDWTIQDAENSQFTTQWQIVPEVEEGAVLMEKGQVYSMLFPYCQGCDVEWDDETNNIKVDKDSLPVTKARDYWDYWSGKFLIFESTDGPHRVNGANYVAKDKVDDSDWLFDNHEEDANIAQLLGNSTFAMMQMEERENIYTYAPQMSGERFNPYSPTTDENGDIMGYPVITPTSTFLLTGVKTANPIKLITRAGQIIYGTSGNGTTTGGNMPTVGGGNDLFITSIAGGINIAVAAPQYVRVLSSTGALLFSGMVQTSVDVTLPANGVYVIAGENEVQKILY